MSLKENQFNLNEEQEAILEAADQFGKKELYPLAEKMDNDEWWPTGIFKKMASAGLLGLTVDPKFGGAGMNYMQAVPITTKDHLDFMYSLYSMFWHIINE